jgi:hypothetical protein
MLPATITRAEIERVPVERKNLSSRLKRPRNLPALHGISRRGA